MRRYGLLLMVLVLASASLLAAAAYNTAVVTNAASLTVVSTDEALLRLTPGNDPDETAWIGTDGELHVDFAKGWGGYGGQQPQSVYYWEDLFWIRGGSNNAVDFTVELFKKNGDPFTSNKVLISIYDDYNTGNAIPGTPASWNICFVDENVNTGNYDSDEVHDFNKGIDVKVEVKSGATLDVVHDLILVVKAHK